MAVTDLVTVLRYLVTTSKHHHPTNKQHHNQTITLEATKLIKVRQKCSIDNKVNRK
jgi:hypothetical protein